ncbi:MAG TPA: thiamine-phosphate kinase [Gammaproteobacteria bacterium]|jgi:thiamine-monophosphate kinase|nr:thiamine-phosphate kinase [Gammaproteobacteria bacterium]
MNEFDIIQQFFNRQPASMPGVILGIGDDCALVQVPADQILALTIDTLVAGVHFFESAAPADIGYKALAVSLSDLAAMGATPAWATLALTLPQNDKSWLAEFTNGFFTLADQYHTALIGGNITRGPLTITVQAHGLLPAGHAVTRQQAKPGDLIYVTNTLGDAGLALYALQHPELNISGLTPCLQRLHRPTPRIAEGIALRSFASAMIDLSDGLAGDLQHLIDQSQVGAVVNIEQLPLSASLLQAVPLDIAYHLALTAGDDYELCFTVPAALQTLVEQTLCSPLVNARCIGEINDSGKLAWQLNGRPYEGALAAYQHF